MESIEIPGKESQNTLEELSKVIARPNYSGLFGITLVKGNNCTIEDADGNQYIDCLAAASSNALGYGSSNNHIIEAYTLAANQMQHSCFLYSPNKHAVALAEKLISITPGSYEKRVMLGLSGSDACDGAIKAARKFTGIKGIIHFKNDYHGSTGLSMPASDFGDLNDGLFSKDELFIEMEYPKNEALKVEALSRIEHYFKTRKAGALITESIQGDSGIHFPAIGFFEDLAKLTSKYNTLFIADEIQSGMGRTGKWWAFEHFNIIPDIIVSAKGLSAGYAPISAIIGRADVLNSLGGAQHVFTYSGHPPSAAVALKAIESIEEKNLLLSNQENGDAFRKGLENIKSQFPEIVTDIRGVGLMIGVEINIGDDLLAGKIIATRCVEKGIYVGFFGIDAEVIRIEPPYIITKSEIQKVLQVISEVIEEYKSGTIPAQTIDNVKKYSQGL